jgi:hypothetical protein
MAEFRKATRTQESNVLNLKLLISRCEIADTLVTLLYARQRSVALLELCSYAARLGQASRHVSRGTKRGALRGAIRGALRGDENDCTKSSCISNKLLYSNPSGALVSTNRCRARGRREMKIIMKLDYLTVLTDFYNLKNDRTMANEIFDCCSGDLVMTKQVLCTRLERISFETMNEIRFSCRPY